MLKVALSRYEEAFSPFPTFVVEGSPKTGFYRHLSNPFFRRRYIGEYIGHEGHLFFWKYSKFNVDFKKAAKNSEKVFSFWDNSIWIGCVKLFLLRRENLSSSINMLTNSLKILHSTNIDFRQLNYAHRDQQLW